MSMGVTATGAVPDDQFMVDCAIYCDGVRLGGTYDYQTALYGVRRLNEQGREAFLWLGLREPSERQMASVAETFGLDPIPVEDAVHAQQRPKVERYDQTLFLVVKTINYVPHESVAKARRIAETGEVMIFVGSDFVISVRHGEHSGMSGLRSDLEGQPGILSLGPYGVMQAIVRFLVGHYPAVIGPLGQDIDDAEEQTFSPSSFIGIKQIYLLKRDIVELRRAIGPLGTALQELTTEYADLLPLEVRNRIRDIADQQTLVAEKIAGYDVMLSDLVQAGLSRTGVQQNLDMRRISAWVVIAAVPTMIAAIYGMNFHDMPELDSRWGYPIALAVMATTSGAMYATFRRNRWL